MLNKSLSPGAVQFLRLTIARCCDQLGKIGVQAATPEIHSEGVCLHRPIPAELSLESDEEIGHLLS